MSASISAMICRQMERDKDHVTRHVFAINTLSAYVLTALVERPKRLVYLSSGMHHHANAFQARPPASA